MCPCLCEPLRFTIGTKEVAKTIEEEIRKSAGKSCCDPRLVHILDWELDFWPAQVSQVVGSLGPKVQRGGHKLAISKFSKCNSSIPSSFFPTARHTSRMGSSEPLKQQELKFHFISTQHVGNPSAQRKPLG